MRERERAPVASSLEGLKSEARRGRGARGARALLKGCGQKLIALGNAPQKSGERGKVFGGAGKVKQSERMLPLKRGHGGAASAGHKGLDAGGQIQRGRFEGGDAKAHQGGPSQAIASQRVKPRAHPLRGVGGATRKGVKHQAIVAGGVHVVNRGGNSQSGAERLKARPAETLGGGQPNGAALGVARVQASPEAGQSGAAAPMPEGGGDKQSVLAVRIQKMRIGAGMKKPLQSGNVAARGGREQGGETGGVTGIDMAAMGEMKLKLTLELGALPKGGGVANPKIGGALRRGGFKEKGNAGHESIVAEERHAGNRRSGLGGGESVG